ncbi:MAG TPA: transglutaminase family protein [Burkholderiales bacterium]|nr:transglutaminase family protein [Burkholderiales bacterium]
MRFQVRHETAYRYEAPVVLSQQLLHLSPRPLPWQERNSHAIEVDPRPAESVERLDYFGNPVTQIALAVPHQSLAVRARTEVTVAPRPRPPAASPWEGLSERLRAGGGAALLEPEQFVFESPRVEIFRDVAAYGAKSFTRGRGVLEAALDLTRRIHAEFKFDPRATSVSTPLREVLQKRRGVCQDFAHLMIGCLRALGLAARYVSGYILTTPPPGRPRLIGADASHAWVSLWCGDAGWVDLDPTNDCLVDDEHITLAWGRDFSDVTPMRGVILGGGEQELEVRVTVTPL